MRYNVMLVHNKYAQTPLIAELNMEIPDSVPEERRRLYAARELLKNHDVVIEPVTNKDAINVKRGKR